MMLSGLDTADSLDGPGLKSGGRMLAKVSHGTGHDNLPGPDFGENIRR